MILSRRKSRHLVDKWVRFTRKITCRTRRRNQATGGIFGSFRYWGKSVQYLMKSVLNHIRAVNSAFEMFTHAKLGKQPEFCAMALEECDSFL